MNSIAIAMALETRRAGPALRMTMNGIATGNVETKTNRKTPSAPSQSSLCRCPVRFGDAERPGEREDHNQSEEHLGDALVGVEHEPGGLDGIVGHAPDDAGGE
jgi:hypothetical protein